MNYPDRIKMLEDRTKFYKLYDEVKGIEDYKEYATNYKGEIHDQVIYTFENRWKVSMLDDNLTISVAIYYKKQIVQYDEIKSVNEFRELLNKVYGYEDVDLEEENDAINQANWENQLQEEGY